MTRTLLRLLMVLIMAVGACTEMPAQSKALKKDVSKRVKELKKQKWDLVASPETLDYAMLKYRDYLEGDTENRIPLTGIAIGQNPKIARDNAVMNAVTNYANRAKGQVVGKMKSLASSDASTGDIDEIDKFGAAYEQGVNTKISGLVRIWFVLVRDNPSGQGREFNAYLSLDETAAREARKAAALEAARKAALPTLSEEVEEFIGEPVPEN